MRIQPVVNVALLLLLLLSLAPLSWGYGGGGRGGGGGGGGHAGGGGGGGHGGGGWGGGWGGGGWRGGGWGGAYWGPWYGDAYDYGPYYDYGDPYDYAAPYEDAYGYAPPAMVDPRYAQPPQASPFVPEVRPDNSRHDLTVVSDYHLELRTVLGQKLKDVAITKTQYDAEMAHLDRMDQQAHQEADANGGTISGDQQSTLVQKYQEAYYLINHNFVVD